MSIILEADDEFNEEESNQTLGSSQNNLSVQNALKVVTSDEEFDTDIEIEGTNLHHFRSKFFSNALQCSDHWFTLANQNLCSKVLKITTLMTPLLNVGIAYFERKLR